MPEGRPQKMTRRAAMKAGTTGALGGALAMTGSTSSGSTSSEGIPSEPSVYEKLGVKTVINAAGTLTTLGGSLMPPEVLAALASAAQHFVEIGDLQDRIGERIAALVGVEAALVTTGAAGAMLLATAAAVTRGDAQRIARLPDTTGMKNEVITQKSHHTCYDHQITNCGVKLIDVETRQELDRAINEQTALMLFYNLLEPDGKIKKEEWIEVARRHGIPTLVDAAADVPPVEALSRYNKLGFDMVAFSGGKALSGPSNTGLLLGKARIHRGGQAQHQSALRHDWTHAESQQGGHGRSLGRGRALCPTSTTRPSYANGSAASLKSKNHSAGFRRSRRRSCAADRQSRAAPAWCFGMRAASASTAIRSPRKWPREIRRSPWVASAARAIADF